MSRDPDNEGTNVVEAAQFGGDPQRTLVVRDGPGLAEFVQSLRRAAEARGHSVDEVDDIYDALAKVGAESGTSAAVDAVALPLRAVGDEPRIVRDAFRRVDPAVRLVLLAPRGTGAIAEQAGFDGVVFLPASSRDIASALRLGRLQPSAESAEVPADLPLREGIKGLIASGLSDRVEFPMPTERRTGIIGTTRAADPPSRNVRDVVDLVVDDALQAFAARRDRVEATREPRLTAPPASARVPGDAIGDTDLVGAVLEGGNRLATIALELIRTELHADDVQLVVESESLDAARPGEERSVVRCNGLSFGFLASAQVGADALTPWADWLGHWLRLDRMHEELRVLAWTDELTGAGNRRAFERVLDDTVAAARPERRPVSLMYFDIDNFKTYNDRFGHEAGDEVLRETVELLRSVIRRGDHVFRVGGDEFVVIFADSRGARTPGAVSDKAFESIETIAKRFGERVGSMKLPQLGLDAPGTVSVSAGVATYPWDGQDARSLLRHADQLALQSKRSGKNMITFGPGAKHHCQDE